MERLSINYYNPVFNPAIAADCTLKVVIGVDGLSLSVRNSTTTLVLKSWTFDIPQYEQSIRKILYSNDFITYPYGKTILSFFTTQQVLTPRRMFDETQIRSYLEIVVDQLPTAVFCQEIQPLDSFLTWAPAPAILEICNYFFPAADTQPQVSPLLLHAREQALSDEVRIFAHFRSAHLQISAFERGNLLFYNSYQYEKPSDVLYFTLLAYDQLHCKPLQTGLIISGELLEDSEIYRQFQRFIRNIRFMPSPTLSGVPQQILPHVYIDQTIC